MSDTIPTGARAPAPGRLELVQRFVNTRDIEGDRDDLNKPDDLREFLVSEGLVGRGMEATDADLDRAREVREAIRSLLAFNTGEPLDLDAVATLDAAARELPIVVRFSEDGGASLEPRASGIDAALATIIGIVFGSMTDGSFVRLKACSRHTCRWAFYDRSKNGSSRWCSMKVCGTREKAKAYRLRHAGEQ